METPLTASAPGALQKGRHYSYSLKVGKDVATFSGVEVEPWGTGTAPEIDKSEEIFYTVAVSGTAATVEILPAATATHISEAIGKVYQTTGITDIVVTTALTADQQAALATALTGKTVTLYLPQVTTASLADALQSETDQITVVCGVAPAAAVKGDVAMLDGTFIPVAELDKMSNYLKSQASGIVFWTTAETTTEGRTTPAKLTDDVIMATDFPNCTHGLIVSLTDASASCAWQGVLENNKTKNSETVYENFQNTDLFTLANKDKYETIKADEEATGNVNKILGYQSTQVLRAYNKYCTETDGKAEYIVKAVTAIDQWALSNPAPTNTTGWFLPSLKELHMLCYKDVDNIGGVEGTETKTLVNGLLEKVGGNQFSNEYYWPSLEYSASQGISQDFQDGNHAWQAKGILNKVRAVCAF